MGRDDDDGILLYCVCLSLFIVLGSPTAFLSIRFYRVSGFSQLAIASNIFLVHSVLVLCSQVVCSVRSEVAIEVS